MSRVEQINEQRKGLLNLKNEIVGKTKAEAESRLNNFTNGTYKFVEKRGGFYRYSYEKFDTKFEVVITLKNEKVDFYSVDTDFLGIPKGDEVVVRCYYTRELYRNREEAMKFYLGCMCASEGSECDRYSNIYSDLRAGKSFADDGM